MLTTTTNLPLEYQITKNGSTCRTKQELVKDSDGTYTRKSTLDTDDNDLIMKQGTDITDEFVIKVKFPKAEELPAQKIEVSGSVTANLPSRRSLSCGREPERYSLAFCTGQGLWCLRCIGMTTARARQGACDLLRKPR